MMTITLMNVKMSEQAGQNKMFPLIYFLLGQKRNILGDLYIRKYQRDRSWTQVGICGDKLDFSSKKNPGRHGPPTGCTRSYGVVPRPYRINKNVFARVRRRQVVAKYVWIATGRLLSRV